MTETPRDPHPPHYGPDNTDYQTSPTIRPYTKSELIHGGNTYQGPSKPPQSSRPQEIIPLGLKSTTMRKIPSDLGTRTEAQ